MFVLPFLLLSVAIAFVAPHSIKDLKPFVIPPVYEVAFQYTLPYFSFSEEGYIWHDDRNGGAERASFLGGSNIFIYNNRSKIDTVWSLIPVFDNVQCLASNFSDMGFRPVFPPSLEKFKVTPDPNHPDSPLIVIINGRQATEWSYTHSDIQTKNNFSFSVPDDDGYSGTYLWYQALDSGMPLRFHTKYGHNVVLGGSHVDEYFVDYVQFKLSDRFPDSFFMPPYEMKCVWGISPFGPTVGHGVDSDKHPHHAISKESLDVPDHVRVRLAQGAASHPSLELDLPHPESLQRREAIYTAHAKRVGRSHFSGKDRVNRKHRTIGSLRYVAARNRHLQARGASYAVGLTHFSDMSHQERKNGYISRHARYAKAGLQSPSHVGLGSPLGPSLPADACDIYQPSGLPIPDGVDLVRRNLVVPPEDQGSCGSCWTYGATGAVEGAAAKAKGDGKLPPPLSQQMLMDCTWDYGNNACNGGTDYTGFSWVIRENMGFWPSDVSYGRYLNEDGWCHYAIKKNLTNTSDNVPVLPSARLVSCTHSHKGYADANYTVPIPEMFKRLNDILANKGVPVSIAVMANLPDFYFYLKGFYDDPDCLGTSANLDHQVLAVGYTTYQGKMFTRIRNSWSNHWGDGGYIWVAQDNNICGVATSATFTTAIPLY